MALDTDFNSILFPVDFSEMSAATAPHVRGLAELTGATVTLLHVVPWLSAWYGTTEIRSAVAGDHDLRNLEKQQTIALERFREKYFHNVHPRVCVKSGAVAETISDTASEISADVIMMPTRGLGRSRPFLIGATTAKVLHDARCAVWTSPHLSSLKPFKGYRHVLCTVDREDIPPGYLEQALRVASYFESQLSFVTAVPSLIGGFGEERHSKSLAHEFPQAHLEGLAAAGNCAVLNETGPVGDVVRRVAESHGIDLVITNRGHLQHPFGKMRTHIYEIVLQSPCPVLSLCICSRLGTEHRVTDQRAAQEGRAETSPV